MADAPGTPVWFELTTPDPDAAQTFYEQVAGWRYATSPLPEHMGYRMGGPSEHAPVSGLMASQKDGGEPGWLIYFASDDVDADAARVADLGGKLAFGPMDIPQVGRFALVSDPQGVVFALMKQASEEPATAFKQEPGGDRVGHGVWIELATPDPAGALAFYGKLFGWTQAGAMPMGDMGDYVFIGTGEDFRLGAVMSSAATGAPAAWNWYVEVPDIDAAVATAQQAGGTLVQGPDEIPGGSFAANVTDPQGNQVGLVGPRT